MSDQPAETHVVVNLITLRDGVEPAAFAAFSALRDQPACLAEDVVLGFDAYTVQDVDGDERRPDILEVMHVRSWDEWVAVRDATPAIQAISAEFDTLVPPDGVRTFVTRRIVPSEVAA
jgi:hypothetical protein